MTRKYLIEATMPLKERLQKFVLAKPEYGKKIALQIVGLLSDQLAEDFYVDYCLVNDLPPELDDDDNTKDRLIRFITKDVFLTEDVLPSLIKYVDDDVIETVIDYYGYRKMMESVMIVQKSLTESFRETYTANDVTPELINALIVFYKADPSNERNQDFYGEWLRDNANIAVTVWNETNDISQVAQALADAEGDID